MAGIQASEAGIANAAEGDSGKTQEPRTRRRFEGKRTGRGRDRGRRPDAGEARDSGSVKAQEAPPMAKQGIEDRKELAKEMSQVELKEDQDKEAKSFFDGNI